MRRYICVLIAVVFFANIFVSCSGGSYISDQTGDNEQNASSEFDESLYLDIELNNRYLYYLNLPGMVMYMKQGGNLHYINKKTLETGIFCFDPLCMHDPGCISFDFHLPQDLVYCNGYIYGFRVEVDPLLGVGKRIYRIDLEATEAVKVYESDEDASLSYINACGDYIFFNEKRRDGEYYLMRYNTLTDEVTKIEFPNNRQVASYTVTTLGKLIFTYCDDINYYASDPEFENIEKLENITTANVNDRMLLNGKSYSSNENPETHLYDFCRTDIFTGETTVIANFLSRVVVFGVGNGCVYGYLGQTLISIDTETGDYEEIYTFGSGEKRMECFSEGDHIYMNNGVDYVVLSKGEDGKWYKSLEIMQ